MSKKHILAVVIIVITVAIIGVAGFLVARFVINNTAEADAYSKTGDIKLPANTIEIPKGSTDAAFYGEYAYVLYPTGIKTYNLTTGEQSQFAEGYADLTAVCAGERGVFAYDAGSFTLYSFDIYGTVVSSYDFSQEQTYVNEMRLYRDTLVLCSRFSNSSGKNESAFHKLNVKTGEIDKIEGNFKGSDKYCLVNSFEFQDENTLLIFGYPNTSTMGDAYKLYRFDLKKEETLFEWEFPYANSIYYDNKSDKLFYVSGININIFDFANSTGIKTSAVTKADYRSDEIDPFYLVFDKIVCHDYNQLLWSRDINLIIVKELFATDKSVIIYKPEIFGEYNALEPIISDDIINRFKSEYGCDVYIIEYDNDVYNDKIRTKLLANDIDFDIFLLSDPNEDMFLHSILVNGAYEPLNNYKGVIANFANMFDSMEQIMTYKGNVFAVPLDISPALIYEATDNFALYGYEIPQPGWTFDDLWALCDEIIARGGKLSVYPYNVYHTFLFDYVQRAVNSSDLDKGVLKNLLTQIKKYNDAGVLFGENSLFTYTYDWNYFSYFSRTYKQVDNTDPYPEHGIVPIPSLDGTVYSRLIKCAVINEYSQSKEMAANFLEFLTRKENLCSKMLSDTILSKNFEDHFLYSSWTKDELLYLNKGNELLNGSKLYTFDTFALGNYVHFQSSTSTVGADLFSGKISIDEATDLIYNFIYYLCFE